MPLDEGTTNSNFSSPPLRVPLMTPYDASFLCHRKCRVDNSFAHRLEKNMHA